MSPRAQIRYGKSYGINSNVHLQIQAVQAVRSAKARRVCGVEFNGGVGHHTEAVGVPGAVGVTCRFKPYRVYGVQFNGAVGALKGKLKLFLTL